MAVASYHTLPRSTGPHQLPPINTTIYAADPSTWRELRLLDPADVNYFAVLRRVTEGKLKGFSSLSHSHLRIDLHSSLD